MIKNKLEVGHRYYLFTKESTGVYCFCGGDSGLYYFKDCTGKLNMWPDTNGYYGFIIDPTCGEVPQKTINVDIDLIWN
jgi:hypothetical protein